MLTVILTKAEMMKKVGFFYFCYTVEIQLSVGVVEKKCEK